MHLAPEPWEYVSRSIPKYNRIWSSGYILPNNSEGWIAFRFDYPPPTSHPKQIVFKLVTGSPNLGTWWGWREIRTGNGTLGALPLLSRVWVEPDCQCLCRRLEAVWTLALAESGKYMEQCNAIWELHGGRQYMSAPLHPIEKVMEFLTFWIKCSA